MVFNIAGTSTVSFACTNALGITDPNPATVRVIVNATNVTSSSGGGCTLRPGDQTGLRALVEALGSLFLPVLVLGVICILSRAKRPYRL